MRCHLIILVFKKYLVKRVFFVNLFVLLQKWTNTEPLGGVHVNNFQYK